MENKQLLLYYFFYKILLIQTELNEDDSPILGDNNIDLGDQDFEEPMDSPVIFIKVEFQLDWDNMELPFMTIVRPGIPS